MTAVDGSGSRVPCFAVSVIANGVYQPARNTSVMAVIVNRGRSRPEKRLTGVIGDFVPVQLLVYMPIQCGYMLEEMIGVFNVTTCCT